MEATLGVPMSQIILAAEQTVYMVFVSLCIGTVLAIIMSVVLVLTNSDGILKNKPIFMTLNTVINIIAVRAVYYLDGVYFAADKTDCRHADWDDSCLSAAGHFYRAVLNASF